MDGGIYHINKRKRIYQNLGILEEITGITKKTINDITSKVAKEFEFYPSPKFWIRNLDRLLMVLAVVGPLMALPQVLKVFSNQSAGDLSLLSWGSWAIMNIPWIMYGIVHKEKPIIIMYSLWFLINLSMVIGILIYA